MSGSPTGPYRIRIVAPGYELVGPDRTVMGRSFTEANLMKRRDELNAAYAAGYAAGRKDHEDMLVAMRKDKESDDGA